MSFITVLLTMLVEMLMFGVELFHQTHGNKKLIRIYFNLTNILKMG